MKRPNRYPYTRSQWKEMKINFNYLDKPITYIYSENTITGKLKDIDEVNHD